MSFAATFGTLAFQASYALIQRTRHRSGRQLMGMFDGQPHTVWLLVNGVELEASFDALQVGDIVVVHAGQAIPVDGIAAAGMATVDQHHLTGESRPAEKAFSIKAFVPPITGIRIILFYIAHYFQQPLTKSKN